MVKDWKKLHSSLLLSLPTDYGGDLYMDLRRVLF